MASQSIRTSDPQLGLKQKLHSPISPLGSLSGFSLHKQITQCPKHVSIYATGEENKFRL